MPQQATTGPAPMEGIERSNAGGVRGQGGGIPPRRDPYAMEIDRGRNCFACGGFGHMAHNCRNRGRCYELKLKGLSDRTTLVLSNTRELDRVPKTK